jgi:hypothetical protein
MKFMTRQHDVYDLLYVLLNASRRAVACAAELVQYFTNWDEWKRETQRTRWIYKPVHEIEDDLRAYSTRVIRYALSLLKRVGILERRHNPGNCLDRTYQYRIHLEKLNLPDPIRDNSPSATPIKNNSSLQEALEDILPINEPLDNESSLETVSSHNSNKNDSSPLHRLKPAWLTILHLEQMHLSKRIMHLPVVYFSNIKIYPYQTDPYLSLKKRASRS